MTTTRQRDVIGVGYLGKLEDELTFWWGQTWRPIRQHVGSQRFLDQLGPLPTLEGMITLSHVFIDRGTDLFIQHITPAVSTLIHAAGTREGERIESQFRQVQKGAGDNPFRPNTAAWWRFNQRQGEAPPTLDPYTFYRETMQAVTSQWVGDITKGQKLQVERMIRAGFRFGTPVDQIAQQIASVIGLNQRWAKAVENLRAQMISDGYSQSITTKRVGRYSDQLLAKRGVMVARTEIMMALNAGEYAAWKMKQDAGQLDGWKVIKWLQPMADACPECWEAADPDAEGEPKKYEGLETSFAGGDLIYPPIHPHCRCRVEYQIVSDRGQ